MASVFEEIWALSMEDGLRAFGGAPDGPLAARSPLFTKT